MEGPKTRAELRLAMVNYLKSLCPSVQAFFSYPEKDFGGNSPVLFMMSTGGRYNEERLRTLCGTYQLLVHTFIALDTDLTRQQSEDLLDQVFAEVGGALMASNYAGGTLVWRALTFTQESKIEQVAVGGHPCLWEAIPIEVEVG